MRALSPIEIMVDLACGFDRGKADIVIPLKATCPGCGATTAFDRAPTDPPGAATVEIPCPKCWPKDAESYPAIFRDMEGREVR